LIERGSLPDDALLQKYVHSGAYTDCYTTTLATPVTHADFVTAFYTTWLFKLERFILRVAVSRPSTDDEARRLADGEMEAFAAWYVEDRTENQLLMCDYRDRTRSWFMISGTRLYFGSAVVPVRDRASGKSSMGWTYRLLLGFHRLYSRALLYSAKSRLNSSKTEHEA
jgi:hypothetical protein